jgi:hypothetical protein
VIDSLAGYADLIPIIGVTAPGRDIIQTMKFQLSDRFSISDEVLSQQVNDETVLLDLDGESYFALNEVGTRIWQLFQSEHTVAEALNILAGEYEVSREQLETDVGKLLEILTDAGLINRVPGV